MTPRDRVLTTLAHHEPDSVPLFELSIDPCHLEAVTGASLEGEAWCHQVPSLRFRVSADRKEEMAKVEMISRFHMKLGLELVPCRLSAGDGWESIRNSDGTIVDEWGRIQRYSPSSRTWSPSGSVFHDPDDFERFPLPDPQDGGRLFGIEQMRRLVGGDRALAAVIRDPFAQAWEMFTPKNFVQWLYERPLLIKTAIERLADFNVGIIGRMKEIGVDLIISGGDYSEKNGPMISPRFFREVVFPNLRRQVQEAHRLDVKFIKHSDGNLNPLLPDLVQIVDGLHSIDPTAGMDIGAIKLEYGEKLTLIGNVAVDSLCRRSVQEVVEETKSCLKRAAPGGGFILGSSNSWVADARLENCLAMVETTKRHGSYPVRFP